MSRIVIAPGASAPNFTVAALVDDKIDQSYQFIPRDDRYKLLFFYEGDFKENSANELKKLDFNIKVFDTYDCDIYGISVDSVEAHLKWNEAVSVRFPLLSDSTRRVSVMYGTLSPEGPCYPGAFIIGRKGKILWYRLENPGYIREIASILQTVKTFHDSEK